ncbi:MAG: APC family permease [Candidatus Kapabacteria bacterium]|jgi:amino acid transporter|nr:APC family permease [Candidatus Kapabacteria bacterium]
MKRDLSMLQATAINMIDMVGIGPFLTTATIAAATGFGPYAIMAWISGLLLALVDAAIWSELGAAFPKAGGSYTFIRETFGGRLGKLLAFLFIWQTIFQAPLVVASGTQGFAGYLSYLVHLDVPGQRIVAVLVIVILTILLYRPVRAVGAISVVLWCTVLVLMAAIISAGLLWPSDGARETFWTHGLIGGHWPRLDVSVLAAATIPATYSYLGYYNVCHLGAEVQEPVRVIPKSMYLSIAGIGALYLLMQASVYSVLPVSDVMASTFVISAFFERLAGGTAATVATIGILIVAVASLFSVMLGYTRIPYAAARNGEFFSVFGQEHPKGGFPTVSLLVLAALSAVFALTLTIDATIKSIVTVRILTQFLSQAVGLVVYRRRVGSAAMPWRMWLYPIPVIFAMVGWLLMFSAARPMQQVAALVMPVIGLAVYAGVTALQRKHDA